MITRPTSKPMSVEQTPKAPRSKPSISISPEKAKEVPLPRPQLDEAVPRIQEGLDVVTAEVLDALLLRLNEQIEHLKIQRQDIGKQIEEALRERDPKVIQEKLKSIISTVYGLQKNLLKFSAINLERKIAEARREKSALEERLISLKLHAETESRTLLELEERKHKIDVRIEELGNKRQKVEELRKLDPSLRVLEEIMFHWSNDLLPEEMNRLKNLKEQADVKHASNEITVRAAWHPRKHTLEIDPGFKHKDAFVENEKAFIKTLDDHLYVAPLSILTSQMKDVQFTRSI